MTNTSAQTMMGPEEIARKILPCICSKNPMADCHTVHCPGNFRKAMVAALCAASAPAAVREALKQWKCPGCGGSGKYQQDAKGRARAEARGKTPDPKYHPDPVTCKICKGDGLHPTASAALATPEEASPPTSAGDAAERRYFIELMSGPTETYKSDLWRAKAIDLANQLDAIEASTAAAIVSIKPMQLSDGRTDYFVSIKVGDREVTPHAFREEFKAAYHVALYDWLLNGSGEEPDVMEFGPDDWPARVASTAAGEAVAAALARRLCQMFDSGGESQRSARARHASAIFQLLNRDAPQFLVEQRKCDADPVAYLEAAEHGELAAPPAAQTDGVREARPLPKNFNEQFVIFRLQAVLAPLMKIQCTYGEGDGTQATSSLFLAEDGRKVTVTVRID